MNTFLLFHAFVKQTEQARLDSPHNLPTEGSQNHISSKKYLKFLVETKKSLNFAPQKRKVGRVIECAGLEIRYTHCGYRGFESLTFRERKENLGGSLFFVAIYATFFSTNAKIWMKEKHTKHLSKMLRHNKRQGMPTFDMKNYCFTSLPSSMM